MTKKSAKEFIDEKITELHKEGYKGRQAVAIAYNYANKAGYKVERPKKSSRSDDPCTNHSHLAETARRGKHTIKKWKK